MLPRTLSLLLLCSAPLAQAAEPLEIGVATGEAGAPVRVQLRATGEPLWVPACRGLSWEAFDPQSNRYTPLPSPVCGPLQPAIKIDKDGTEFALDVDPGAAQAVRAVVVYGQGCKDERPFPMADCKKVASLEGAPAMIRAAPAQK